MKMKELSEISHPVRLSRQVKVATHKLLDWISRNNIGLHEQIPNMAKLSKEFGVSINTIHSAVRYLRNRGILATEVGSGTFLIQPIDKIDMFDNSDKSKSKEKNSYTIGIILENDFAKLLEAEPEILSKHEYWTYRILRGIYQAGKRDKVTIKPIGVPVENWQNPTVEGFKTSIKKQLTGINGLISFSSKNNVVVNVLEDTGLPWVLINPPDDLNTTNYVSPDYYGASVIVGQIAARLGAENIWMLIPNPNWPSNRQRIRGIRDGIMFEHGKFEGITIVTAKNVLYEDGIVAISEAIEKHKQIPDFIYTGGDFLAEASVDALKAGGIMPGKDVSIISSTGLPEIAEYDPPISSVELPMIKTGEAAVEMMLRMLKTNQYTLPAKIIPTPIVLRETTPPKAQEILYDILHDIEKGHLTFHESEMAKIP